MDTPHVCPLLFWCLVFIVVPMPCVHCCSGALCSLLFRCLMFIVVPMPCVHCCSGALCSLLFRCLVFIVVPVPCVHCCSGALCSLLFRCLMFIVVPVPCWSSAFPFLTRTESPSGLRKTFPFPEQDSCATAVMVSAPRCWHPPPQVSVTLFNPFAAMMPLKKQLIKVVLSHWHVKGFSLKRKALKADVLQDRKIRCVQACACILQSGHFTGWGVKGFSCVHILVLLLPLPVKRPQSSCW